jgi:hypothetical protein
MKIVHRLLHITEGSSFGKEFMEENGHGDTVFATSRMPQFIDKILKTCRLVRELNTEILARPTKFEGVD